MFTELSKPATLHIEEFLSYYEFDVEAGEEVLLKGGTSFTSVEAAERNLQSEIGHWNFEQTKEELREIWEQQLGKIVVKTNDLDLKEQFYSALYRASFLPRTMNDVDGAYPAFAGNGEVKRSDTTYYDDFSMWDTFRALHPLITILDPQKSGEMMQSLVDKYEQGGWMPIFPCWNSYTAAMIGDHCAVAIADAYVKGVRNFDAAKAYEGLRKNAFEHPTEAEYKYGKWRRSLTSYL